MYVYPFTAPSLGASLAVDCKRVYNTKKNNQKNHTVNKMERQIPMAARKILQEEVNR